MPDTAEANTIDLEAEAQKLRKHFKFTEADLMANQSGVLSEKQIKQIAEEERGGKKLGWIIGSALLIGAIVFTPLVLFWMSNLDKMKDILVVWLIWGFFGLVFGLIVLAMAGWGIFLIVSQIRGKAPNKLLTVRGKARLVKGTARGSNRRSSVYYDLHINDQEFDGDGGMDKAIISGAEYIVFYLEGIAEILSVELISPPN